MIAPHHHRGFTLIEMAIVLVITGIVIGGIWAGTAIALGNAKKKQFLEQTLTIVTNSRNYIRQQGSLSAATISDAVLPPELLNKPTATVGTYLNSYGGTIRVDITADTPPLLLIQQNRVPLKTCIELYYGYLAASADMAAAIGYVPGTTAVPVVAVPSSLNTITTACRTARGAATTTSLTTLFKLQ